MNRTSHKVIIWRFTCIPFWEFASLPFFTIFLLSLSLFPLRFPLRACFMFHCTVLHFNRLDSMRYILVHLMAGWLTNDAVERKRERGWSSCWPVLLLSRWDLMLTYIYFFLSFSLFFSLLIFSLSLFRILLTWLFSFSPCLWLVHPILWPRGERKYHSFIGEWVKLRCFFLLLSSPFNNVFTSYFHFR